MIGAGVRAVVFDASLQGFTLQNQPNSLYTGIAAIPRARRPKRACLPAFVAAMVHRGVSVV
jgi:hypothetical protein